MITAGTKVNELRIRRSRKALGVEMFLVQFPLFIFFVIITAAAFIFLLSILSTKAFIGSGTVIVLIFLSVAISFTLYTSALYRNKKYIITKDRIIVVDGIFGTRQRVHNVKGNTSMQLMQTPIKKFFNYGTITMNFMGGDTVTITNVSRPEEKMHLIQEMIDKGEVEIS